MLVTRTQAQRRASTQAKILDATVEALVHVGYAGASTTEICKRAGVSQGALFRYWPTKGELLADAAKHLLGRVTEAYEQTFAGRGGVGAREALEGLWETYRLPDLQAFSFPCGQTYCYRHYSANHRQSRCHA